jgi:DNA modification methylase
MKLNHIYNINSFKDEWPIDDGSIDCIITSPPYWALRDYGEEGQLGLEKTFNEYLEKLLIVMDKCKRVLKPEGTLWVNLGDTYMNNSSYSDMDRQGFNNDKPGMIYKTDSKVKQKSLCMIPERFAIAMIDRGWILRNQIIWHKPACMPSSVKDRFTVDFEKVFFFTKNQKYYFEQQIEGDKITVRRGTKGGHKQANDPNRKTVGIVGGFENDIICKGRNKRTVWSISTQPFSEAHFAVYPEKLIETPIIAGCPVDGVVLDPFMGAGTTALVALKNKRNFIGLELSNEYIKMAEERILPEREKTYFDF